ncbi:MAG: Flp pilus assembly protein CpaB [Erythrobacter sp.]
MRQRNIIIIAAALFLGLIATFLANAWFTGVEAQKEDVEQKQELVRIAVADADLAFGDQLTGDNVRLLAWPAASVPQGSFGENDTPRLVGAGNVAIRPIARGEPILVSRISERAVLSANLPSNMRAVTVPVDPVTGVAGFVTPGDVVDVLLTRQIPGDGATSDDKMTSVIMESIQVLAVDLRAGEQNTDPAESKTATLMVTPEDAQKLVLSTQIGRLSLALRNVQDQSSSGRRIVTARQMSGGLFIPERRTGATAQTAPRTAAAAPAGGGMQTAPRRPRGPQMVVVRGTEIKSEDVRPNGY